MNKYNITYNISEVAPYINWIYFYYAWQVHDKAEQAKLRSEAENILGNLEGKYHTHALFALGDANSDGDDIIFDGVRIPMLRQQKYADDNTPNMCLADFLRPASQGIADRAGIFCTTVDIALEKDFEGDEYMRMMIQLLADRMAEATAELMHLQVRKTYWGYAPGENLTMSELHAERFQGIRPAIGYPSMPDTSLNFVFDSILGFGDIGIRLTESGAMKPHASVSGMMFSHPRSCYFNLGRIGEDQLADYARRRNVPVELMRRFLSAIL